MSKPQEANDVFAVYQQNVDSLFSSIEKSIPSYAEALTGLRQEYVQAYENAASSVISAQKEFASKTGINVDVPDAALNIIRDVNKQTIKTSSVQNQIALVAIDAAKQNVKTWNDNAKTFADLNKDIIQSWISAFTQTTKN